MNAVAELVVETFPLEAGLEEIDTAFSTWERTRGEGTRHLWSLLAKVYELGNACEVSGSAKDELIAQVAADPAIAENPKWIAHKKSAHELLLVKLLGLRRETRSTRSQWHSALKAAKLAGSEPNETAFIDYLEAVGGVEKARQSTVNSRPSSKTFEELVQMLDLIGSGDQLPFRAPTIGGDEVGFRSGYALVLVRGEMAGHDVVPLATIVAPKVIEAAMTRALARNR